MWSSQIVKTTARVVGERGELRVINPTAPQLWHRMVVKTEDLGQYYGVEGMNWKGPPILDDPSGSVSMAGRRYNLFYDGSKLRLVSWRSGNGVYWVSNTLSSALGNRQMLALARSVGRIR